MFHTISIDGRGYRYSEKRLVSGRPATIEYLNRGGEWKRVRNVDRSDQIWRIADGESIDGAQPCGHATKIRSCGILVCLDCGQPLNTKARAVASMVRA